MKHYMGTQNLPSCIEIYFTCLMNSLMKYFSIPVLKKIFCISAQPCNILYLINCKL